MFLRHYKLYKRSWKLPFAYVTDMAFSLCEYSHAVEDNRFGESLVTLSILVWTPNSGTNLDISFTPSGSMGHLLLFFVPELAEAKDN